MKRSIVLLLLFFGALSVRAGEPAFNGSWLLDLARSEGLPQSMDQSLAIEQSSGRVRIRSILVTDFADRTVEDVYEPGAGERTFDPQLPGIAGAKGTRIAHWVEATSDAPAGFDSVDKITGTSAGGPVDIEITRHWRLLADGTLAVSQSVLNFGATTKTRRVFVRK
jgi:hypothetical protein